MCKFFARENISDHLNTRIFNVDGLSLKVQSPDVQYLEYIEKSLLPVDFNSNVEPVRSWNFRIIQDLSFFSEFLNTCEKNRVKASRISHAKQSLKKVAISDTVDVCYRASQGTAWIVDRDRKSVYLVISHKTKIPLHEAFKTVRNIIVAHLHDQDWFLFHAGIVIHKDETILVVGDGGAGKTSYILGAMAAGASFVANERCLLKTSPGGIKCFPFPQQIFVGLGTAINYPVLEKYILHPHSLWWPASRLNLQRVAATPREEWVNLPDKLAFTAGELANGFGSPKVVKFHTIQKVLLPNLTQEFTGESKPSQQEVEAVLANNILPQRRERHYPDWMPLGFVPTLEQKGHRVLDELNKLPATKLSFWEPNSVAR